jgi:NADH:ubiquinone oxidoreductase subunit 5 (subunit L)/multisubunit Na+/H+ antiporter MnhA subunit
MINQLIFMVPILPMLSALWIALSYSLGNNRGEAGEKLTVTLASSGLLVSLILILLIDFIAIFFGVPGEIIIGEWLHSGDYQVLFNFYLDSFALSFATLIALVSYLGVRFSINYLHREQGFQRFFMLLCLFSGAMLLIVTSGNMLLTFFGWEIAGICSYLLIAYNFSRTTAVNNATRVVITNRIGDAGFIMAIICSFWLMGDINWQSLSQSSEDLSKASHQLAFQHLSSLDSGLILGSFLLAALVKSAQFPFSPWISRALEGPTPSSALFYGSLMVHSGVYLLIRLQPLLEHNHNMMLLIAVFGLLTIIYGYFCGLVQSDIKSALIFSTTTQTGLMFILIGLGYFDLAAWYLVFHASWRAFQFLHAPSLMHMADQVTPPASKWISNRPWLFTMGIQRFWLDHFANWAIVSPIKLLAHDAYRFEQNYISHILGNTQHTINEKSAPLQDGRLVHAGLIGFVFEKIASYCQWFEENLVLKSSGEGLLSIIQKIGKYLIDIEEFLNKPRYLMVLVSITFIIII